MHRVIAVLLLGMSMVAGHANARDIGDGWDLSVDFDANGIGRDNQTNVHLTKKVSNGTLVIVWIYETDKVSLVYSRTAKGDPLQWFMGAAWINARGDAFPLAQSDECYAGQKQPDVCVSAEEGLLALVLAQEDFRRLVTSPYLRIRFQSKSSIKENKFFTLKISLAGSDNAMSKMTQLMMAAKDKLDSRKR